MAPMFSMSKDFRVLFLSPRLYPKFVNFPHTYLVQARLSLADTHAVVIHLVYARLRRQMIFKNWIALHGSKARLLGLLDFFHSLTFLKLEQL